jgi:hypothetical protein
MWAFLREVFSPARQHSFAQPQIKPKYTIRIRNTSELGGTDIRINSSVLDACPFLNAIITDGCTVTNVEYTVFKSLIDFLSGQHELPELLYTRSILLNFAEAWVLGRAIGLPEFQNTLIKTFRGRYLEMLSGKLYIIPSIEPINFLRNTVGYHTVAEKFIIDFYAGLLHASGDPGSMVQSLPWDIAQHILDRVVLISQSRAKNDRILNDLGAFAIPSISVGVRDQGWSLQFASPAPATDRMIPHSSSVRPRLRSTESARTLTARDRSPTSSKARPPAANRLQSRSSFSRPALRTAQSSMQLQSSMHQGKGPLGLGDGTEICYFPAFTHIIINTPKGRERRLGS